MRRLTSFIRPLAAGLAAFVVVALAHAEARADPLVLTLNDPVQNIPYSGLATFFGTLSNVTPGTVIIGTPGFTQVGDRVPFSYEVTRVAPSSGTGFLLYGLTGQNNPLVPTELAGGASTGIIRLFSIGVAPGGTFSGVFTIHYYLPEQPGVLLTASANFRVNAGQTPEPATSLLLGSGIAGLAGLTNRRRKSRRKDWEGR
jgi:hypothetical protein